jgi:hypothetical protein
MYSPQYQWGPVGGHNGYAQGGKGYSAGKGSHFDQCSSGKGKYGKGKGTKMPKDFDKTLQQMQQKMDRINQDYQALALKVVQVKAPTPPAAKAVVPPQTTTTAKPVMYNSKGLQVEVAWTCTCGQQHWSAKVRACVHCKKASTAWTKVPAAAAPLTTQPPVAKKETKSLGPFKNNKNLTWFQQMGLLMDEEASDDDEAMDVEEVSLDDKRGKATQALQDLQGIQADPELIRVAQAQLDAIPLPLQAKPSQEHWDVSKLKRIQAQLVDGHNAQCAKHKTLLEDLHTQAAAIHAAITEQQATMQLHQQQFDKYHQACLSAVALKQVGGAAASGEPNLQQEATPTQVTSAILATQLKKAEDSKDQMDLQATKFGVDPETLMKIMRFAFSGAITGAAADEGVASAAAAGAQAAATPIPA